MGHLKCLDVCAVDGKYQISDKLSNSDDGERQSHELGRMALSKGSYTANIAADSYFDSHCGQSDQYTPAYVHTSNRYVHSSDRYIHSSDRHIFASYVRITNDL
jgi:hypothetical protein